MKVLIYDAQTNTQNVADAPDIIAPDIPSEPPEPSLEERVEKLENIVL